MGETFSRFSIYFELLANNKCDRDVRQLQQEGNCDAVVAIVAQVSGWSLRRLVRTRGPKMMLTLAFWLSLPTTSNADVYQPLLNL
jgi:hypothetical protein